MSLDKSKKRYICDCPEGYIYDMDENCEFCNKKEKIVCKICGSDQYVVKYRQLCGLHYSRFKRGTLII